jgi:hypothetical protein
VAYRVARAQGFSEGNKRTAMLLAKWTLDRNDIEGETIIPPHDASSPICSSTPQRAWTSGFRILELFRSRQGP